MKNEKIADNDIVNVTQCGDSFIVTKSQYKNRKAPIRKLNKDEYIDLKTGEVRKFKHKQNRADNILSARRSMARLRNIITSNTKEPKKCRFLTLTYKKKMTNQKLLTNDFKVFLRRLKADKMKKKFHFEEFEYIVIYEPQGRGSFHIHALLIFDNEEVFIPNTQIQKLWGHGFTKTKKLKENISNFGAYFCSYFTDMSVYEVKNSELDLKELSEPVTKVIYGPRGGTKKKKFVKGARYNLMKSNSRLYSCSRGIERPTEYKDLRYDTAKTHVIGNPSLKPDHSDTFVITDEKRFLNKITKETYNP